MVLTMECNGSYSEYMVPIMSYILSVHIYFILHVLFTPTLPLLLTTSVHDMLKSEAHVILR